MEAFANSSLDFNRIGCEVVLFLLNQVVVDVVELVDERPAVSIVQSMYFVLALLVQLPLHQNLHLRLVYHFFCKLPFSSFFYSKIDFFFFVDLPLPLQIKIVLHFKI